MFRVEMKTRNAAFGKFPALEVARILRGIYQKIEEGQTYGPCMDGNGQKVGQWEMSEDE